MGSKKAGVGTATPERDRQLRAGCARFLSHHRQKSVRETLATLARHPLAEQLPDLYGDGGAVGELERRVVALLGKPAGVFFAKGVIAQECLARVRSEQRGSPYLALSPLSHIDVDEANGIEYIHNLRLVRLGRHAPFVLADLQRVRQRLAAVIVELPLRRAGFLVPPWRELERISAWCRDNEVPLHFDGARLWEAAAGYGRTLRTVAALADSIYVSFYKGIGGLGGCVVAGTRDCIDALEVWRTRQGAALWTAYPYALSALDGLDRHLPRMPDYVRRARRLAARLRNEGICQIHPLDPAVNAFQVILAGAVDQLKQRNRDFAAREKVWLFNTFFESPFEGQTIAEIVIGDAADAYTDDEACDWLRQFQAMSGQAAIRRRVRKPTARHPRNN
ncbi:MAG TPA: beta-eliminating lyase-related protein [Candidatus Angelobacter sp.]|nr:beta-eliminating lyase-related protein [Candidatus Angelobacter sp.]